MEDAGMSQGLPNGCTAVLVLADGRIFPGLGVGKTGEAVGEVCFNTAMTGYQEILTDPSYTEQLICFTFPHIGNVGTNLEDEETASPVLDARAKGVILRANITKAANWRSEEDLANWLQQRAVVGITGIDTRALTNHIRENGMPHGVIAHDPKGRFDLDKLQQQAANWPGLVMADLAAKVSTKSVHDWQQSNWQWPDGFDNSTAKAPHVVLIDYGVKRNIARLLSAQGLAVSIAPASFSAEQVLALQPDGIVLSNGPGDPAATAKHAAPVIQQLIAADLPVFGICLGHQLLALALGGKTRKMSQGHHGANHPVKQLATGKVEIVSMNHGFSVDASSLGDGITETHISLFDGSNCGLELDKKPVFSVQHHPEASPGPQDSFYLFAGFADMVRQCQSATADGLQIKPAMTDL
ncbi:Carbamoyl-phosphate synthase small chain [hydrothermal vent metagenome]|uniref:carbamoyl-phosphate synthase (glutamine-hydrolyzing) n=1 Tax=hydrothermal vent metagenome TaxID=652676 RepID=A0A3B0S7M5_9ZZZZ